MFTMLLLFLTCLLIYSAIMVVHCNNPINSLLFLMSCFIITSIVLILLGLEFIALLFISIYVGAITVLFAFVITMINIPSVYAKSFFFDEYFILLILWGFSTFFLNCLLTENMYALITFHEHLVYLDSLQTIALLLFGEYPLIVLLLGIFLYFGLHGVIFILIEYIKKK